ncbi:hypothetical protein IFM89_011068 [Coptis chinensis]|uniref:Uncharacterized protein n=1 Tax=Coptis chinensis TaxID=261450 RepID=A0A835M5F0_9MAGN|nr:hypothetical protein IFM89_011068 [Coptis chinensis]
MAKLSSIYFFFLVLIAFSGNLLEQKQKNFSIWMSKIMDITTETMSGAIDDVVGDDDAEEETDDRPMRC